MPQATARNQPDEMLAQYATEVNAEMHRRGLEPDWRDILRRYIEHVAASEGTDFIDAQPIPTRLLTDEEFDLLRTLRDESR